MPARDIVRKFAPSNEDLDRKAEAVFATVPKEILGKRIQDSIKEIKPDQIIPARILSVRPEEVVVDYGGKSEGSIHRSELPEDMKLEPGEETRILFGGHDDETAPVTVSWRRAVRRKAWDEIVTRY